MNDQRTSLELGELEEIEGVARRGLKIWPSQAAAMAATIRMLLDRCAERFAQSLDARERVAELERQLEEIRGQLESASAGRTEMALVADDEEEAAREINRLRQSLAARDGLLESVTRNLTVIGQLLESDATTAALAEAHHPYLDGVVSDIRALIPSLSRQ